MSYLEFLRVFPLGLDTLTLPYWSWERWVMIAILLPILLLLSYPLGAWLSTIRTLVRLTGSQPASNEAVDRFANINISIMMAFAILAGSIYCIAGLIFPESIQFYRDRGIASFTELDIGGWMLVASIAIMAWMAFYLIVANVAHFRLLPGLLHALPYFPYAGLLFLFGALLGPVALLPILQPSNVRSGALWIHLRSFIIFPLEIMLTRRRPSFKGAGIMSLSKAVRRATKY